MKKETIRLMLLNLIVTCMGLSNLIQAFDRGDALTVGCGVMMLCAALVSINIKEEE